MKAKHLLAVLALALTLTPAATHAQTAQPKEAAPAETPANTPSRIAERQDFDAHARIQTIYLTNVNERNEANEILVALRNMLPPFVKIYLVDSQDAIVLDATPEQIALAERIVHDLDRPRQAFRLTYTITDLDNGQRTGTEHYSMIVVLGQETTLKQGEKVPVATGSYSPGSITSNGTETQFTYLDIGMDFNATLYESANNIRLQSKIEESSIAEHATIVGVTEPIVRQTVLQGTSFLTPGKPLILGTLDIAGTTRRMEISVVMDLVP